MNIRITIGQKLAIGFGVITLCYVVFLLLTNSLLKKNEAINKKITEINLPSEDAVGDLRVIVDDAKLLMKNWVYIESKENAEDKDELTELISKKFPVVKKELLRLCKKWDSEDSESITGILVALEDSIFVQYSEMLKNDWQSSSGQYHTNHLLLASQIGEGALLSKQVKRIQKQLTNIQQTLEAKSQKISIEMKRSSVIFVRFLTAFGILFVVISVVIAVVSTQLLTKPINYVKKQLLTLSRGELSVIEYKKLTDELGEMIAALKKMTDVFRKSSEFAQAIGEGKYETEFKPQGKNDVLGNALINLKDSLEKASKEAEERREADRISNWTTNGLANFAELLRKSNNISVLAKSIITELVRYMDINQGGIFAVNEDDKQDVHLEMLACYAYGRDRYSVKRIDLGEGIVGTTFLERETVVMSEVPNGYTEITSGLGEATPSCIMVVPLKTDDQVLGVLELASFNVFQDFEIKFVERIASSIATTIANVRVAEETSKLLALSKEQTEKMKDQEDMMKQNIEELEATQEEAAFIRSQMEEQLKEANFEIEQLKAELEKYTQQA